MLDGDLKRLLKQSKIACPNEIHSGLTCVLTLPDTSVSPIARSKGTHTECTFPPGSAQQAVRCPMRKNQKDKLTVRPWVWLADRLPRHRAVQSVAANRFAYMLCLQCETDLHCSWQLLHSKAFHM